MKKLLSISFAISLIFSMVSFCFTSYAEGYPNVTSKSTITSVDSIGAGATGYNLATDGSKVSLTSSATFNKQVQTTFSVSNMSDLIKLADWDNGKIAIDFPGTFNTGSSAFCYIKAKWDGG